MDNKEMYRLLARKFDEDKPTMPTLANVLLTTANQEYEYQLPRACKRFRVKTRDGTAFRLAFEKDKVGTAAPSNPYYTVPTNGEYDSKNIRVTELHLYLACGVGGKVAEVISWV